MTDQAHREMDEREGLEWLIHDFIVDVGNVGDRNIGNLARAIRAAGYRPIPEPGSAEWKAMVERMASGFYTSGSPDDLRVAMDRALRAALASNDPKPGTADWYAKHSPASPD